MITTTPVFGFSPRPFKPLPVVRIKTRIFGQFDFDLVVEPESYYDITVDSPFAFTLTRGTFFAGTGLTLSVLWGASGGPGASPVDFDVGGTYLTIDVDDDLTCHQPVPFLGYVQINVDAIPGFSSTTLRGTLFYTRS